MTLVLLGLPGVGKTTVGAGVAARLGWPFLDFDQEIERREGMTVGQIFESRGEAAFRALESALTHELAGRREMVLAPGGGWVTQPALVGLLRPPASLVYLRAEPATVAARLAAGRDSRPLLRDGNLLERLEGLLAAREGAYTLADHIVDTELLDPERVIDMVAALAPLGVHDLG